MVVWTHTPVDGTCGEAEVGLAPPYRQEGDRDGPQDLGSASGG